MIVANFDAVAGPWFARVILGTVAVLFVGALVYGIYFFRYPRRSDAIARIDATLRNYPIQAMHDRQVIGTDDAQSANLWQAHQKRMLREIENATAIMPEIRHCIRGVGKQQGDETEQ